MTICSSCLHWNLNLWHSWNFLALSLSSLSFIEFYFVCWKLENSPCYLFKKDFCPHSRSIIFSFCWLCLIWGRKLWFTRLNFETRNVENFTFYIKIKALKIFIQFLSNFNQLKVYKNSINFFEQISSVFLISKLLKFKPWNWLSIN